MVISQNHTSRETVYSRKVRLYYTPIALQYRYIDYFLPQVTAASPHFKLKRI